MSNMTENNVQNSNVDNVILTALIALIGSGLLVLSVKKPENIFLCYSLLATFFFNMISFLGILWHKVRWQKRRKILDSRREEIVTKHASKISRVLKSFLAPKMMLKSIMEQSSSDGKLSEEKLKSIRKSVADEPETDELIRGLVENLGNEMNRMCNVVLQKPLNERFARIKHLVDIATDKTRYYFFTVGIVFWFISLYLHLFS